MQLLMHTKSLLLDLCSKILLYYMFKKICLKRHGEKTRQKDMDNGHPSTNYINHVAGMVDDYFQIIFFLFA